MKNEENAGFRVPGSGFRVPGSGFRVFEFGLAPTFATEAIVELRQVVYGLYL